MPEGLSPAEVGKEIGEHGKHAAEGIDRSGEFDRHAAGERRRRTQCELCSNSERRCERLDELIRCAHAQPDDDPLAGFGAGVGLVISQLGNVVMASVDESRSSEAGGVQGAAQNLGQSLGTALIGAVLLTGLTTGFQQRVQADPTIPPTLASQIQQATDEGVPMVSKAQVQAAAEHAGLQPAAVQALVGHYSDAQIQALKRALFVASLFVLVGLWFARELPSEPLAGEAEDARAPAPRSESAPVPSATPAEQP